MKLKAIASICKKMKSIMLFSDPSDDTQWISDGMGIYPMLKMPYMTENNIYALFDIPDSKSEKIYFERREFLPQLNFTNDDIENKLKEEKIFITRGGRTLKPFQTSKGLKFIDTQYIKPISDELELYYYERFIKGTGDTYIVVKNGMEVIAIILPFNCIDEDFVKQMDELTRMCKVAYESNKDKETV